MVMNYILILDLILVLIIVLLITRERPWVIGEVREY